MFPVKEFDLRDDKGSHFGQIVYRDEDIVVSVARESRATPHYQQEKKRLIVVSFKKLAIDITTFDFVDLAIELGKDASKKEEFAKAVLGLIKLDYDILNKIVKLNYDNGFKDGQYELKATIRGLLGVEECTQ